MPDSQEKENKAPLVKICGITTLDQCQEIAKAGSDLIGINFWPQSKRFLAPAQRSWLVEANAQIPLVGVFVNPSIEELEAILATPCLSMIQLHGDESPEFVAQVQQLGLPVIKAFQVKDESTLKSIARYQVEHVLLDAYHPTERGGLGEAFPWHLAQAFKTQCPDRKIFLAGGLHPDNVAEAVHGVAPYAVDVASGVESGIPGIKDMEKVKRFINAAKFHAFQSTMR